LLLDRVILLFFQARVKEKRMDYFYTDVLMSEIVNKNNLLVNICQLFTLFFQ